MIKKCTQLFSNGSVNLVSKVIPKKQFDSYNKDHNNFFLNKKQKSQFSENTESSMKFKNQYLKF